MADTPRLDGVADARIYVETVGRPCEISQNIGLPQSKVLERALVEPVEKRERFVFHVVEVDDGDEDLESFEHRARVVGNEAVRPKLRDSMSGRNQKSGDAAKTHDLLEEDQDLGERPIRQHTLRSKKWADPLLQVAVEHEAVDVGR